MCVLSMHVVPTRTGWMCSCPLPQWWHMCGWCPRLHVQLWRIHCGWCADILHRKKLRYRWGREFSSVTHRAFLQHMMHHSVYNTLQWLTIEKLPLSPKLLQVRKWNWMTRYLWHALLLATPLQVFAGTRMASQLRALRPLGKCLWSQKQPQLSVDSIIVKLSAALGIQLNLWKRWFLLKVGRSYNDHKECWVSESQCDLYIICRYCAVSLWNNNWEWKLLQ